MEEILHQSIGVYPIICKVYISQEAQDFFLDSLTQQKH